MYPALIYRYGDFEGDVAAFLAKMEEDRKAVKTATGYTWDNTHYYLQDCTGKVIMTFSIYEDYKMDGPYGPQQKKIHLGWSLHLWTTGGSESIDTILFQTFEEMKPKLAVIIDQVSKGLYYCYKCGGWFEPKDVRHYSFAGVVCAKCYDPKVHLPPDTSGD